MNRRTWIGTLIAAATALCVPKLKAAPKKYGYVAIGVDNEQGYMMTLPGDWIVKVNGQTPPANQHIQRVHDIDGWYEYIPDRSEDPYRLKTIHVKANVELTFVPRCKGDVWHPFRLKPIPFDFNTLSKESVSLAELKSKLMR